jgi:FAD/FMN-containing dehydrogenase
MDRDPQCWDNRDLGRGPICAPRAADQEVDRLDIQELRSAVKGQVLTDEASLEAVSSDFGRMKQKTPWAILRPAGAEDIAAALAFARRHRLPVSTRAQAHTQTGQGLNEGGILIDTNSLDKILALDTAGGTAMVQAGVVWRDLVAHAATSGLMPPVLTNNLGVTIGGTLSVAGLGVASFRHGAQGDNVLELEAVMGTGEIVTCSRETNPEMFDLLRSSLGQFGIITRAKLRLRPFKPNVRMLFLLYDDLDAFMGDAVTLMSEPRVDHLESWCVPAPMGFRTLPDGQKQAFAQWFYPLHATVEFDGAPPEDAAITRGLKHYRLVHAENRKFYDFLNRLEPLFQIWKRAGYWANTHPWMECILPWETSAAYIGAILAELPPQALGGGHILLWPSSGRTSSIPNFMRPDSDWVMGFGILPGIPRQFLDLALPRLDQASDLSMAMGAKRYLSGYINFDKERWRAHFGERWPVLCAAKKKHDPDRLLNPGFIDFD